MIVILLAACLHFTGVSADALVEPMKVRATSDSSRTSPMAWAATLTVEENYVDNGYITFWTRSYCYLGECHFPGPTIELVPGDNFTVTLVNNLGPNPVGEDTTMNSMHSPNNTNVHTHGLHIDPSVDTVFTFAQPGESLVYKYQVPHDHGPGLHWHHDHTHGGSALRVMGGLVGAIIVRPTGNENLPSSISEANEYVLVLHKMNVGQVKDTDGYVSQACSNAATCDPDTQPPDCTNANYAQSTTFSPFRQYSYHELSAATGSDMDPTVILGNYGTQVTSGSWTYWDYEMQTIFTNGQLEPTLTVTKNEVITLRIVYAAGGEDIRLQFTGGDCTFQVIALDGVYLEDARAYTTSDTLHIMAGSRVDVQMQCTGNGPGSSIKAASQYSSQNILTVTTSGTAQTNYFTTTQELGEIIRPFYLTDLTEATVNVYYSSHVSQGSRPQADCGGSDLFWWGAGTDCSSVAPWGSDQPSSSSQDCPFGFFEGSRGLDPTTYENANKLVTYLGNGKTDGEVNEWSWYGLGRSKHPVHLHVFHMQIVEFTCVDGSANCDTATMEEWLTIGDWRDVLPTFEGQLKVRFRVTDFAGETVLHCHFLRHEDLGMMDTVLVVDGYRPGYVPTPSPSVNNNQLPVPTEHPISQPTEQPTNHPIPQPTQQPTNHPIPQPTPKPTNQPIPQPTQQPTLHPTQSFAPTTGTSYPTSVPLPVPTASPTEHPSPQPTENPTLLPTSQPTSQPTYGPTSSLAPSTSTESPTKKPIPMPTVLPSTSFPTYQPSTLSPTTPDTLTLSVSLSFSATAEPTYADETTLKDSIVAQLEIEESSISNFEVDYTAARRHLLAGTWDVSFDISVSLATTSFTTASQFQTSVEQSLEESGFETSVAGAIPSITGVVSVSSLILTRSPTSSPTSLQRHSSTSNSFASFTVILIGGGVFLLLFSTCSFLLFRFMRDKCYEDDEKFCENFESDDVPEYAWRSSFGRNSSSPFDKQGGNGGLNRSKMPSFSFTSGKSSNNNTNNTTGERRGRPTLPTSQSSSFMMSSSESKDFSWRSSFGRNKRKDQEDLIHEMTVSAFNPMTKPATQVTNSDL